MTTSVHIIAAGRGTDVGYRCVMQPVSDIGGDAQVVCLIQLKTHDIIAYCIKD